MKVRTRQQLIDEVVGQLEARAQRLRTLRDSTVVPTDLVDVEAAGVDAVVDLGVEPGHVFRYMSLEELALMRLLSNV